MHLTTEFLDNGVSVIRGDGRLNLVSANNLRQAISDSLERNRIHIVLDLAEVSFVDSSGLRAIVGGLKAARLVGGDLRIAAPTVQVSTALRLSTLDHILRSYDTPDCAYRGETRISPRGMVPGRDLLVSASTATAGGAALRGATPVDRRPQLRSFAASLRRVFAGFANHRLGLRVQPS